MAFLGPQVDLTYSFVTPHGFVIIIQSIDMYAHVHRLVMRM